MRPETRQLLERKHKMSQLEAMPTHDPFTLRNGATILEQKLSTLPGSFVVLALWGSRYVTWKVDKKGNAYWGRYFMFQDNNQEEMLRKAKESFDERN